NAPLWTELFISNKEKLVEHINNFEAKIEEFKKYIQDEDADKLRELLSDTREKRLRMGSIRSVKK
ncbi:prephenate dehydrogenase/arogenate dehydrogenase family protein, partial [bacterium]|nr:prephenate dehydrogenase/arogenate dehydrogenase family protein [bacterium]